LERFNSKSILNLRKEKSAKIRYFWKCNTQEKTPYLSY
jgi:hypothetical protein